MTRRFPDMSRPHPTPWGWLEMVLTGTPIALFISALILGFLATGLWR
jgi:hypothetical protein